MLYWELWVCSALTPVVFGPSLSTRGLGGGFTLAFTGRKPQVIKLQDASKKPRVDLLVRAVLVLLLMRNEDFRAPPRVLLPGTVLPQ